MSNETALVKTPDAQEFSAFGSEVCFVAAQRMAKALCSSSIVPTAFQGDQNIGNCVIALEISNRIGASVLAVMQNIFIIHGKPGWSAQFLISCVNASRKFTPLRYKSTGEKGKDSWGCIAWATDKSGEELASPEVTVAMAKAEGWYGKNGSKWQTMPELMLRYRAATFFARLYAPELTMGIQTTDEIAEVIDIDASVTPPEPAKPTFTKRAVKPKETVVEVAPVQTTSTPETSRSVEPQTAQQTPETPVEPAIATIREPIVVVHPAIEELTKAMTEGKVSTEQILAFAASKKALKEGTDEGLAILDDILPNKVPILTKMIQQRGAAYKEIVKEIKA